MVIELDFSGAGKYAKPWGVTWRLFDCCGDAKEVFVAKESPQIQG
jgi:hypothetical protein